MKTETKTETKAQHTPGPWEVEEGGGNNLRVVGTGNNSCIICGMPTWDAQPEEMDGNARLIAAAPALLAACKALLAEFPEPPNDFVARFPSSAVRTARAAIAQAEPGHYK